MKVTRWISLLTFFVLLATLTFTGKKPASDENTIILKDNNSVSLMTEVNGASVGKVINELYKLDSMLTDAPIYLVLYTPGGSIEDGFNLMTVAQGLRRKVHTVTIFAASMGFQIAQALGDRYITQYGTLMSHKAKGGFSGEFPGQVNSRLNYWLDRLVEMDKITVARTKGKHTLKSYQDAYENELWLTGYTSVEQGFADKIIGVRCDKSLMTTYKENVETIFGVVIVTWSKCPLITEPVEVEFPKVDTEKKKYIEFLMKQKLSERRQVKSY
jgi:ATP-dependent Clp protease, protease subunit